MNTKRSWSVARMCLLTVMAFTLAGCGGSSHSSTPPPPPSPSEFLYAGSFDGIMVFPVDPSTGALGSGTLAASGFVSIGFLANMVAEPAGKFLFVFGLTGLEGFSIDTATGVLTAISGSPFPVQGIGAGNLAMDPSGRFLYAPTRAGVTGVTAFVVNSASGTLSAIAGSPFSDGSNPNATVVDPSGKFLYASGNTTQNTLSVFAIDSTGGTLKPIVGSPFLSPINSAAESIAVHPSGKFLYVGFPLANGIGAWSINCPRSGFAVRHRQRSLPAPGAPFRQVPVFVERQ
jgi:6-phosphogluconolactonase